MNPASLVRKFGTACCTYALLCLSQTLLAMVLQNGLGALMAFLALFSALLAFATRGKSLADAQAGFKASRPGPISKRAEQMAVAAMMIAACAFIWSALPQIYDARHLWVALACACAALSGALAMGESASQSSGKA